MKTRKPIPKQRKTLRRGEPSQAEKQEARLRCAVRAGFMCELRVSSACLDGPLPLDGPDHYSHGHLCHLHSKRRFGWMESDIQKHRWGCHVCHSAEHNAGGKPVPAKDGL